VLWLALAENCGFLSVAVTFTVTGVIHSVI
jgi:hypothetical protein